MCALEVSVPPLMYGVLKDSEPSGGVWGVMVAAEPATEGDGFDARTLNTFRSSMRVVIDLPWQ